MFDQMKIILEINHARVAELADALGLGREKLFFPDLLLLAGQVLVQKSFFPLAV
jgi:hypothetical protein